MGDLLRVLSTAASLLLLRCTFWQTGGRLRDEIIIFEKTLPKRKKRSEGHGNLLNSPDFLKLDRGDERCIQDFSRAADEGNQGVGRITDDHRA